jgi:hypothetical protein
MRIGAYPFLKNVGNVILVSGHKSRRFFVVGGTIHPQSSISLCYVRPDRINDWSGFDDPG